MDFTDAVSHGNVLVKCYCLFRRLFWVYGTSVVGKDHLVSSASLRIFARLEQILSKPNQNCAHQFLDIFCHFVNTTWLFSELLRKILVSEEF